MLKCAFYTCFRATAATADSLEAAESSAEPRSLNSFEWHTDMLVDVEALQMQR